jgi:aspartyl/asparaginyl-tRNA synthetase
MTSQKLQDAFNGLYHDLVNRGLDLITRNIVESVYAQVDKAIAELKSYEADLILRTKPPQMDYSEAVEIFHADQYGWPQTAYSKGGEE